MIPSLLAFDLETTGTDVENDRIVTAYAGLIGSDGTVLDYVDLLVAPANPDGTPVTIPDGAAAVHGVTNQLLEIAIRAQGAPTPASTPAPAELIGTPLEGKRVLTPVQALNKLSTFLDSYTRKGIPLAGSNLAYDLTLMDREVRRHLGGSNGFTEWLASVQVTDCLVIDKAVDKYRKGSRKLVDLAAHYGVALSEEEAHGASADAVAAARIIQRQLQTPALAGLSLKDLHDAQVTWKREQAASLQAYFRSPKAGDRQDPNAIVDGAWPMKPFQPTTAARTKESA